MEEPIDPYTNPETSDLVQRYENLKEHHQPFFFDVDDYEELIDYYFYWNDQAHLNQCINDALDQHPQSAHILLKKAQFYLHHQQNDLALQIMEDTDTDNEDDPDLHMLKGNLYSQMDQSIAAIREYKKAIRHSDIPDDVYTNIAFEYENLGKHDKAIDFLILALDHNPENEAALYELSFCCEISRQTERIIEYLSSFLDRHPYSKAGWFNLGIAMSNLELYEKAIVAYDYAIAIDESFSSAYFNKANCLANLGNYEKAIETYFETFQHEDPEPITFYYVAECYEKLKMFEFAIEYYKKAITLDSEFADAWIGIGISYDELGKPHTGLAYIQKALKLAPAIPEYWFILGDLYIRLNRIEEGIIAYRKVIELDPDNPDIWLDLSVVYADRKEYQQAYDTLYEGLRWHEEHADFHYGLAYYLYMMGKSKQAGEVLAKALEMDFEGHQRLFTTFPEAKNHPGVIRMIEIHRK